MSVQTVASSAPNHPILGARDHSSAFIHMPSGPITVRQFLADVASLTERLPEARYVINLCGSRYRFTVGFVAALQRGQVTLLPASEAAAPLAALAENYASSYFLHDGNFRPERGQRSVAYPTDLSGTAAPLAEIPLAQEAAILFTSGSTGEPVPQPRSWRALVSSTLAAGRSLGAADLAGASVLGTVPHQHSYGLESIVMLALQHGLAINGARSLLPADIIRDLEAMPAPRILVTTPIHLRALAAHAEPLPPLHRILCATAPLSMELARRAEMRFGAPLHEIYGCSEVGQIAMRRTVETLEWTCLDGIELAERDGEIWASGVAAAKSAPLNDVIERRDARRFLLHGRKADMINIAGKRSSLAYLNNRLNAIEGVIDGVFILPDGCRNTTRLTAYVVAPTLTAKAILAELRQWLDPAFLPRPIHFVEALPRNALGKLTRHAMEQLSFGIHER